MEELALEKTKKAVKRLSAANAFGNSDSFQGKDSIESRYKLFASRTYSSTGVSQEDNTPYEVEKKVDNTQDFKGISSPRKLDGLIRAYYGTILAIVERPSPKDPKKLFFFKRIVPVLSVLVDWFQVSPSLSHPSFLHPLLPSSSFFLPSHPHLILPSSPIVWLIK